VIETGEVHLADVNEERRRLVLVVSTSSFHQRSNRVLVAPQIMGAPEDVALPWRVQVDTTVFAIDRMRTVPIERLLERVDRAPSTTCAAIRRAVRFIA
jgi:mRNA-degrading endonuclease toxin of MazEF toxin-antitoxin module